MLLRLRNGNMKPTISRSSKTVLVTKTGGKYSRIISAED